MTRKIRKDSQIPAYMAYPRFLLTMDISETAKLVYVLLLDQARLPSKIYVQVQTENCSTGWTSFKSQTDKKLSTSNKQRKTNEKPIRNYDYEEGDSL